MDLNTLLKPGMTLEVIRAFKDYDKKQWNEGEKFERFLDSSFVPYAGGYTFTFSNHVLRLCENEESDYDILSNAFDYFRVL